MSSFKTSLFGHITIGNGNYPIAQIHPIDHSAEIYDPIYKYKVSYIYDKTGQDPKTSIHAGLDGAIKAAETKLRQLHTIA